MDIVTTLRKQAIEVAEEDIPGWGNTMTVAADEIERLRAELTEARKPDCRTCLHYTGTGYCEVIFGKACEEGSRYIPQRRFESGPLRLYEKEGK